MADDSLSNNPLLKPFTAPYGAPPLDQVRTEHVMPAITEGIRLAKAEIEAIKNNPAAPTFENTIEALEHTGRVLGRVNATFFNMVAMNGDEEMRKLKSPATMAVSSYDDDIYLDEVLFKRVKAVYDVRDQLMLTGEQKMLLKDTHKAFVDSGVAVPADKKEEVRKINERLADLTSQFADNATKSAKASAVIIDDEADLKGLSEHLKGVYAEAANKTNLPGKWLVQVPQPLDFLTNADNRALREKVQKAWDGIADGGPHDNNAIGLEIVQLRQRMAQILGYKNFAEYELEDRMAKNPQTVKALLDKNEAAYRAAFAEELKELTAYARKTDGLTELKQWDILYYQNKVQQERLQLDMEEVRQYFDLEKVLDGVRQHVEKLFNIEMKETSGKYPVFHPDIKVYEVFDKASGDIIGVFYTDYYARPGLKDSGAWMSSFRDRMMEDGESKIPMILNTCNFNKPAAGQPTLLSLKDVTTLFHEMGHGLHGLLGEGQYGSQTGTAVVRDFVELPSQFQENYVLEKEVLDTFARHSKTGQPMPDEMIVKLKAASNFDAGYRGLRQTFFAQLDYALYNTDPAQVKSLAELEDTVRKDCGYFLREEGVGTQIASFKHILSGGYAMGYYSYKWAEVLDADVFSEFQKKGLYDRDTADRLRKVIYAKGGSVEADELYRQMMGRDPDPDAMFRREGLLKEGKKDDRKRPPKRAGGGPSGP